MATKRASTKSVPPKKSKQQSKGELPRVEAAEPTRAAAPPASEASAQARSAEREPAQAPAVRAAKPDVKPEAAAAAKPAAKPAAAPQPALPALEVARRSDAFSPENFAVAWLPRPDGGGELAIAYEGPLAGGDGLYACFGTWRDGSGPWTEPREVALQRQGARRYVGVIQVPDRTNLRAIELALRTDSGAWDNGGRAPLGYYEWRPEEPGLRVC